jgi:hypothetical protein
LIAPSSSPSAALLTEVQLVIANTHAQPATTANRTARESTACENVAPELQAVREMGPGRPVAEVFAARTFRKNTVKTCD